MEYPTPDLRKYAVTTLIVVVILGGLEYFGIFSNGSGDLDVVYLIGIAVIFPLITYLWSFLTANVSWFPTYESMNA